MMLLISLVIPIFVYAGPLAQHETQLESIDKRIRIEEETLKDLEINKTNAREGKELEEILNGIATIHMKLLKIRRERAELKRHLRNEHPDDDLIFDARLHKDNREKKNETSNDPVDKKLDDLLKLMQKQYARFVQQKKTVSPNSPVPPPLEVESEVETNKERYLNKAIQTQMRVKNNGPAPQHDAHAIPAPAKTDKAHPPTEPKDPHGKSHH